MKGYQSLIADKILSNKVNDPNEKNGLGAKEGEKDTEQFQERTNEKQAQESERQHGDKFDWDHNLDHDWDSDTAWWDKETINSAGVWDYDDDSKNENHMPATKEQETEHCDDEVFLNGGE